MTIDFTGRSVVVTGGAGALGAAVVQQLVRAGADCHVPVRRAGDLDRSPHLSQPGVTVAEGVELTDEASVERFYAGLPALWASIHAAGGFAMGKLAQTSLADFRGMMDINAVTCLLCCREAAKRIRASGGQGRIVNVAARPALVPTGGMIAYAASKAAVRSITESLAIELAPERIWVNAVIPSIMDTPANRAAMPKADPAKWSKVDEVAATILFLASPQNTATRSALVPVYGTSA